MNSEELLNYIESMNHKWSKEGVNQNTLKKFTILANHFNKCNLCYNRFNKSNHNEENLNEFIANFNNIKIEDFVCKDLRPRDINGKIKYIQGKNSQYRLNQSEVELILLKRAIFDNNLKATDTIKKMIKDYMKNKNESFTEKVIEELIEKYKSINFSYPITDFLMTYHS